MILFLSPSPDQPKEPSANSWFDRYKWCEPIAQGGMGVVYLAEDKHHNNARCVIKQLRSDSDSEEEFEEGQRLFKREVEMLRDLDHPGIVRFFDHYASEDGKYLLVMEHIAGNNLETIIQNYGPFSQEDAVKVGIQICEVLEYLHERVPAVIYRDLKPSNLMLTPDGQIVFIDFGIARVFMPKQSATRVVTAGYSPPEQYFGKPETRSDLYAFGATMAHLLTGMRPRPLLPSIPSQKVDDILPSLDNLVKQCTSHTPADRPESARLIRHRLYRIYQEIHPDFEIPEEALSPAISNKEEQFISQRIRQSGLKAASSASESLPHAKGAESEVFSDENMPTGVQRVLDDLHQRLSSQKVPAYNESETEYGGEDGSSRRPESARPAGRNLRSTIDKLQREPGFLEKLMGWFKR